MVLDWLGGKSATVTVPELVARKQFDKAVELAQAQVKERPKDARLRQQLADTYVVAGRAASAVPILNAIADELATDGFAAKAIAVLKRIQKIDPRASVEVRLAELIQKNARHAEARPSAAAPSAGGYEIGMEEMETVPLPKFPVVAAPAPVARAPQPDPVGPEPPSPEPEILLDGVATSAAYAPMDLSLEDIVERASAGVPAVATPLFPDFTTAELVAVMGGMELTTFHAGDVIVGQGEPGDSLFLLTTGVVKAWVREVDGRYRKVRELKEGDFFGEISILSGRPRTATVTAAARCELLELDRATLDRITAQHPRVREVLQRFHDERLGGE